MRGRVATTQHASTSAFRCSTTVVAREGHISRIRRRHSPGVGHPRFCKISCVNMIRRQRHAQRRPVQRCRAAAAVPTNSYSPTTPFGGACELALRYGRSHSTVRLSRRRTVTTVPAWAITMPSIPEHYRNGPNRYRLPPSSARSLKPKDSSCKHVGRLHTMIRALCR